MLQNFSQFTPDKILYTGQDQEKNDDNVDLVDLVLKNTNPIQNDSGGTDHLNSDHLLPSDAELLFQLISSDSKNGDGSSENFQFTSFEPTDETPLAAQEAAPTSPESIRNLIHGGTFLGSEQPEARLQAQENLIAMGPNALPLLLLGENRTSDRQLRNQSREVINRIVERMNETDLLNLREPQNRARLINDGLGRAPTQAEACLLETAISSTVELAIDDLIRTPNWLVTFNDVVSKPSSEKTIEQIDRMRTPEGRADLSRRMNQLARLIASDHITDDERMRISFQLNDLTAGISPSLINELAIRSRNELARQLRSTNGSQERIEQLYDQAAEIGRERFRKSSGSTIQAVSEQLASPEWARMLTRSKGDHIFFTDESLRQMDRLATPAGRRELSQRLEQLSRVLTMDGVDRWSRESLADQVSKLSHANSPPRLSDRRIEMRTNMAELLVGSDKPEDRERMTNLILDAHRIAKQNDGRITDVIRPIVEMNLDRNPAFMDRFRAQARPEDLESLRVIRLSTPVSRGEGRSGKY